MMCCMPTGISDDASVQMSKLMRILKILCVVQLFLGIMCMFASIMSGIYTLIGALLLFLVTCSKNWCTSVFYIVLSLMDFIQYIMLVGNYLAKHGRLNTEEGVLLFLAMIKLPFYVISMYYCFLAYKELKALFLEVQIGSNSQALQSFRRSWDEAPRANPPVPPPAYVGPGYRLG